jgi:5,10-methylenetetrahydrofolate reductase
MSTPAAQAGRSAYMKKDNNKTLAKKIRTGEKTILYELLPPPKNLPKTDLQTSLSLFIHMLNKCSVDGINIPEVREEVRHGTRASSELAKLKPVMVASYLRRFSAIDIIINRPIVYETWEKQKKWLKKTYEMDFKNFIFVGGESSKATYPGISVTEAAEKVTTGLRNIFADICIGGITIPTRRIEAQKLMSKTQSGIEFFTSQVLYESSSVKVLLKTYSALCQNNHVKPKMIFLSFAPIASVRDAELLLWLGVDIPGKTLKDLKTGWFGMAERSIQICEKVLSDILLFVQKEHITVPIGLNIEHISRHNFEISFILLERLSQIYLNSVKIEG